jgi:hypothetical protein
MPEQISKYPEVTLEVLKGAGAVCGEGAPQKILTQCPVERFCSLPTGEMCIYGIHEIPTMTQIKSEELAAVVVPQVHADSANSAMSAIILVIVFLAGLVLGRMWQRSRMSGTRSRD